MTHFNKLSDDKINTLISSTPINSNIRGNGHHPFEYDWLKDDGFCFRMLKHYKMFVHSPFKSKDPLWTIYAPGKSDNEYFSTNTNPNRAILECFLQIHEAEQ